MEIPAAQTELRILMLEDEPSDAELVQHALREAGLAFVCRRVDTRESFMRALEEFKPDLVLADYKLPAFDGATAVRIVREQHPGIPVVMVTGAVGDEKAVELLRQGAKDYIIKDRLARLGSAVQQALSAEQGIRARKAAEQALRQSEAELRALTEHSPIAMIVDEWVEEGESVVIMNRKFTELFGYTMEDVPDVRHWWPLAYPDEKYREEIRAEWIRRAEKAVQSQGKIEPMEATVACKDRSKRYVRVSFASIGNRNIVTFEDLTGRKQMEDALKEASDRNRVIMETASDAIVCMRPDGIIHLWNHKAEELFGYTAGEAIGQNLHQLIVPERHHAEVAEGLRHFVKTGTGPMVGKTLELTAWRKGRIELPIELSISAMGIRGEWHATGIIRDITGRKQAEARIQKLARLYATLSQTNATIVRSASRDELFRGICRAAVEHGRFVMAWVGLADETARRVNPVCHDGAEQGYLENISISTGDIPEDHGPTGNAIRENRICYINNLADDERALSWREAALKRGFHSSVGLPLRLKGKAIGALTLYAGETDFFDAEQLRLMEEMSNDVSFALDSLEREALRQQAEEERGLALVKLQRSLEGCVRVAASMTEMRDPYTAGHQQRVSQLAVAIATEMGLPAGQIESIHFGSLVHDIGKVGVPAEILSKPSMLMPLEMELIHTHPQAGYEIVRNIEFPWPVAQMILQHHERLDGTGYPAGLKEGDILLEAKIIAVADVVEAMSSHRPYRPGLGMDAALAEITGTSGVRYDKKVVEVCVRLIREKGFMFIRN